ncbi:glycosyltransferase family 4 protein [Nostoc sp.]|uniref:glycosyltransferase family 4 protein n=1 Tax=Nostoc sp. TaxID=1180 RepID=UPI002FF8E43A
MKLLIQQHHYDNEIAGVLTYIYSLIPELEVKGIEVKSLSTKQDFFRKWLNYIVWLEIVHMNSNHLVFAILCKILGKKIIIKYHYTFYQSAHTNYQKMSFKERIKLELSQSLPKANYPLKWKLYTAIKWLRLATRLMTATLADSHTACSNFLAESCAFTTLVETLYNPIKIINNNFHTSSKVISQPYQFVFVGRLDPCKGVDILLKATQILQAENQDFRVLIIGDGTEASQLTRLTSDLKITNCVSFLGKLSHQEVLAIVQDALALVVPSRWQEPAGYVVLEASSVETCSIVSKMGGLPEIAGPHSLFFKNEDAAELASSMRYCLNYPDEAIHRGFQSNQYVGETFSPARTVNQLLDICRKLYP